MKKMTKSYLLTNVPNTGNLDSPTLLRITIAPEFTKVDFGFSTFNSIYSNGGWIQMSPETYLKSVTKQRVYKIINADGISFSPKKHYFESHRDWQFYSLYFEPIPFEDDVFEIIEPEFTEDKESIEAANEISGENFDFFDIQVETSKAIQMMMN
jgi:hypothetical protein